MDTLRTAGALKFRDIIGACAAARAASAKLEVLADGYVTPRGDDGRHHPHRDGCGGGEEPRARPTTSRRRTSAITAAVLEIAAQLRGTGELANGLTDEDVANIIYFHFRFEQFTLAAHEFGWGEARARDWIRERIEAAILRS